MDPESTFARVERTWWTVWYYITGAVNRFLRPSPADTEDIDPNSFHESTEHRDPPDRSHEEDDSVGRVLDEEQSFAKASEHGSFCSVVASNICTADIHLRPDNKSTECKKQLSGGTEDGEGTREERLDLTGNDDTGPPAAEGVAEIITLYTCRQDEKNEGRAEHKSDDVEKSEGNTGTEEEEVKVVPTVMLDNGQKVDETITEEQEDIMLHEDEQCLEEEGIDIIELRPEEEESIHRGETGAQMDDEVAVVTAVDTDVVLHESEVTEEDVKQLSVCEELLVMSEDESAVTGQERPMARCSEIEDEGEQEEEKISDAANNQQTDEVPEQGKDTTTEKHMLTECVPCSEEGVQNAEQDDVAVTEMQTKTRDTAVTVSPETGQEIREFKNISPGTSESPVVMLQEVNTPTCEETQEGVPEYNNELRPDENLTQKILEVEDCEEIQTFQLPEEEGESLQKGGSLLVREPMEENQESITGDISWSVGTASQESGRLCEEEEGKLQESSMKTEFQTTEELQGETEELLVHFGTDEVLYDSKDAAEEVCDMKGDTAVEEEVRDPNEKFQKMPENSFFDESGQALATEQNNIRTLTFKGDITDSGFLRHSGETERELLEEMQEERDHVGEMQKKNQQVVVSEVSLHLERQDNQSPGMSVEMSEKEEMIKDAETADESNTSQSIIEEHVTETEASPRHQDVIDEELLDLWIETAMSEDTDNIRQQEGPEQEQQMDTEADLSPDKVSPKKEMEQLMESHSGESAFISDTEISSSTVESESLDQSLGEWGTQNLNEAQLQKPTSSLQGIDDMLLVSAPQSNSESHVDLMEGRATTEQYPDSGVSSPQMTHLNEESDKSQGSTEETGSQRDMEVTDMAGVSEWKDTEQAEVTKMRSPFQVEEKEVNDEPLVSDSPDEITHTEFISDSVEEEIILNEATSQSKEMLEGPQPGWLGKMSQDLNEVDAPLLDFTVQKSRIAVKNPLIRPPKDPRSLLNMPSADPTPSPRVPIKAAAGVPLGGLGIGIKLPGIGAGFPVLKKTKVEKDDNKQELISQETEKKPQETSEAPQQDEVQHKPKWMPPRHPGFGNPLISELKTKLKKTTKE